MNRKNKKIAVIATILVLLLLVSILVGLNLSLRRKDDSDNLPDEPSNLSLQIEYSVSFYDEGAHSSEAIKAILPSRGQAVFRITGTDSYTVTVVSNINDRDEQTLINFYVVDGCSYLFSADDYTAEFIQPENLYSDYFVIDCTPGYYGLNSVLCRKMNSKSVTFFKPVEDEYPFKMLITSSSGETIEIQLKQE